MSARPPSPHQFPRAADCRPYGAERGRSVIEGRGHFIIEKRAGTQAGSYGDIPPERSIPMDLRRYRTEDLPALSRLFGETVRRVNIRDYTPAQVEAWAAGEADLLTRDDWFRRLYTLVAEIDGQIAGYGNVDGTGYLDHLFVRWDCQGRGVATVLCDALEEHCRDLGLAAVTVHASKTALPFFLHRGYRVEREQQVPVRGQVLANYAMHKELRR